MRGSHNGPPMPGAITDSHPARFDGPPRVVGMGFQLADGHVIGPRDMLGSGHKTWQRGDSLQPAEAAGGADDCAPGSVVSANASAARGA